MKVECKDRILEGLKLRGLRQIDLCRMTGLSKNAVSQYCNGAYVPKQKATYIIAKALDVSEAWLMGFDVPIDRISHAVDFLSENDKYILRLFNSLDYSDQKQAIKYIKDFLLSDDKYQNKKETSA